jgi:hypothetical protein
VRNVLNVTETSVTGAKSATDVKVNAPPVFSVVGTRKEVKKMKVTISEHEIMKQGLSKWIRFCNWYLKDNSDMSNWRSPAKRTHTLSAHDFKYLGLIVE